MKKWQEILAGTMLMISMAAAAATLFLMLGCCGQVEHAPLRPAYRGGLSYVWDAPARPEEGTLTLIYDSETGTYYWGIW